jgi:hypothetical protein
VFSQTQGRIRVPPEGLDMMAVFLLCFLLFDYRLKSKATPTAFIMAPRMITVMLTGSFRVRAFVIVVIHWIIGIGIRVLLA